MHDDAPTAEVAGFLRQAASAFPADPPAPGPELALLMAAGLAAPVASVRMNPTRSPSMIRTALSTLPGKLALAAAGLTFATAGLGVASALPGPLQDVADGIGSVVGLDPSLPDGATTTTSPEVTTTPTTEASTTPTTAGTTPSTAGTTPTTVGPTPTTLGPGALAPAATTAAEAAHIHDFDEACGNHGRYVSYVAKNGTEPSCAAEVRTGTTTPPTTAATSTTTVDSGRSGRPSTAESSGQGGQANDASKGKTKG